LLLLRSALVLVAVLINAKAMAAEMPPMPDVVPLPEDQAAWALYNNACANAAAAFVSNTEKKHADQLPDWIKICNSHPRHSVCRDTADVIESVRGMSPLSCAKAN
jgi:hypothetical protein